ncbi:flagellar hook protein FlgE [Algiphilus sp.]|uniref:flagellar hook protein FlgE n=1 Tax=Algiphilus sp. TaxID=1872431 RepID=UPI0025C36EC8|nr:flagellar hook protein FlgE [Algiphilus sp.]MCK5771372.1 flagellar hook protein FlgE [Algiphilus sp.]
MSFSVALSGINAASENLSVTGHNVANANTTGFKSSRAEFADVFANAGQGLTERAVGNGVRLAGVRQQFGQGSIEFTNNALDLAISGQGFLTFADGQELTYSRAGALGTDRNGYVVNPQGSRLQVFPASGADGFDTGQLADLQVSTADNPPRATSAITAGLNLPASSEVPETTPFDPDDTSSFNHTTSVTAYDSLGQARTVALYFSRTANDGEWELRTRVEGQDVGGPQTLTFDSAGRITSPAGGEITLPPFAPGGGADDLELSLDLSDVTQFGGGFSVSALSQDGFATGRMTGLEITREGIVQARFTNGQATPLGQVALTNFANPEGLSKIGDTAWAESYNSGPALRGVAGAGDLGTIESGALEASNVDLTAELVNMITAQRTFQANAQMITTSDQVTQTILNIRR